jgi:hypothetical protein
MGFAFRIGNHFGIVIHAREVVSGINVSRPPEEEVLECHERARAQRITRLKAIFTKNRSAPTFL